MKVEFKGFLFNRIEKMGDKEYNHIGCEDDEGKTDEKLLGIVPEIGMRKRVKITFETIENEK